MSKARRAAGRRSRGREKIVRKRLFYVFRGKRMLTGLAVLLFFAAAVLGLRAFAGERTAPEELLAGSLKKTLASESFRYRMEVRQKDRDVLSQVEGEWASPNRVHLKGKMYNTPVEFIQIGETVYLKDIFSEKWLAFQGNRLGQAQLYILELAPLTFLQFKNVVAVRYAGRERLDKEKMLVLECRVLLQEALLNEKFKNCRCAAWVAVRDGRIRQLRLEPAEQEANLPLLTLRFWDYDRPVAIEPPGKVED